MIISNQDEAKRSRIWRAVMTISSILIIVIAIYLLTKMFMSNPLEGTWINEDNSFQVTIKNSSTLTVRIADIAEEESVDVKLAYSIDKDEKMITIKENKDDLEMLAEKSGGMYTEETLEAAINSLITSFDYSVDGNELTLTEREYGEQMVLTKED